MVTQSSPADLSPDVAYLLGALVSMLLYGMYLSMFFWGIPKLWARRHQARIVFWVTIVIFVVSLADISLMCAITYDGFIRYRESLGTIAYYTVAFSELVLARRFCFIITSITADVLLTWRTFIIWGRSWKVITLPIGLLVVTPILAVVSQIPLIAQREVFFTPQQSPFRTAANTEVLLSLILNVYCTLIMSGRLWWISRRVHNAEGRSLYRRIILGLIESGALFTVTQIIWIVFLVQPSFSMIQNANFVELIFNVVVVLTPMLIVLNLDDSSSSAPASRRSGTRESRSASTAVERSQGHIQFKTFTSTMHPDLDPECRPPGLAVSTLPSDGVERRRGSWSKASDEFVAEGHGRDVEVVAGLV